MKVYYIEELELKLFELYSKKIELRLAHQAKDNFLIIPPSTIDSGQMAIEGKQGDYIVKGRNGFFVVPKKHFEKSFECLFFKEDFDNVLSFYKRKAMKKWK